MKKSILIHKVLAGFLLVVFAISITPKKYFHDFFSCHTDYTSNFDPSNNNQQLAAYKFSCGFVNTVAVTPFTSQGLIDFDYQPDSFYLWPFAALPLHPLGAIFSCFAHRGPPIA